MREDATYAPKRVIIEAESQAELDEAEEFLRAAETALARILSHKIKFRKEIRQDGI